jgi:hypothetical protein
MSEEEVPDLPDPRSQRRVPSAGRPIVMAAVIGGGACLAFVIVGLVVLGISDSSDAQIAQTGLASIGATLAGGFAGWIGRASAQTQQQQGGSDSRKRSTDP